MAKAQVNGQMDLSNFMNMETPTVFDIEKKVLGDMEIEDFSDDQELDLKPAEPKTKSVKRQAPLKDGDSNIVMSKYFQTRDGKKAFVEYHNYNRVIYQFPDQEVCDLQLDSSGQAVEKYVSIMYQMMDDKKLKESK